MPDVCFYHDKNNRELDIIVQKRCEQVDEYDYTDRYSFYEVKMTGRLDSAVMRSEWINDSEIVYLNTVMLR